MPSTALAAGPLSTLLTSLMAVQRAHPDARKILIASDINYGREALFALACRTGEWAGWEAANLRSIAEELAFTALGETDRRAGTDVEITALANQAVDLALTRSAVPARFCGLAGGLGFRHAIRDALLQLRTAGVRPTTIQRATTSDMPVHDLATVLAIYEEVLARSGLLDAAGIFALACERFDVEAPFVLDGVVVIAPALSVRGLPRQLLQRIRECGAETLPDEPVLGVTALEGGGIAACDFFAAATPADELREVLRRTLAEGLPWDAIEIAATDPDSYGIALDALCRHLEIGVTMLHGVPLIRTRIGRALERWLSWLADGLPADTLREALEAGELMIPGDAAAAAAVARVLRTLQIGWERDRYLAALGRLRDGTEAARIRPREMEDEDGETFARRKADHLRALSSLAELLDRLLAITPPVPERGRDEHTLLAPSVLARATLAYLEFVRPHDPAEESVLVRLRSRLEQLAAVEAPEVDFSRAMAELRDGLADLRAWPGMTNDRKPWSAGGGMLHLTNLAHAGATARRRTFVVGLDADRTAGPSMQDPFLSDAVRVALGADALPTTAARRLRGDRRGHARWYPGTGYSIVLHRWRR
jgi:hypothetical protein